MLNTSSLLIKKNLLNKTGFIGWDIGGAHVKVALLNSAGDVQRVVQLPCALWRGLSFLELAIDAIFDYLNPLLVDFDRVTHAVTMTGELVDLFENRQSGVLEISRVMHAKLQSDVLFFHASQNGTDHFVKLSDVSAQWKNIASVNWLASAYFIGQKMPSALLIDMGSTTTDFIILQQGQPQCLGFTDAARLQSQELLYTGVIRTPLMALTQSIVFKNKKTFLAAEYFATTADVYRLLGELPMAEDMADTADGKDKSQLATARRIARMIGHDVEDAQMQDWLNLAQNFKNIQLNQLAEVATNHIARVMHLNPASKVVNMIGAGAGQFLLKQLVQPLNEIFKNSLHLKSLRIEYHQSNDLIYLTKNQATISPWASICLPAVAVATLAVQNQLK